MMYSILSSVLYRGQLPEAKRIANDQQFCIGTLGLQTSQKFDEFGRIVALLQLSVTAEVQIAHQINFLYQVQSPSLDGSVSGIDPPEDNSIATPRIEGS